jgi:hypothetical protein
MKPLRGLAMALLLASGAVGASAQVAPAAAEAEVQALRSLEGSVCGPALSARSTARTTPARSTTVAATL